MLEKLANKEIPTESPLKQVGAGREWSPANNSGDESCRAGMMSDGPRYLGLNLQVSFHSVFPHWFSSDDLSPIALSFVKITIFCQFKRGQQI